MTNLYNFYNCKIFSSPPFQFLLFKIKVATGSRNYGLQKCNFNIVVRKIKIIPAISVSTHAYASAPHDFSRHDSLRLRRRSFFYGTFSIYSTGTLYPSVILSIQPAFYVLTKLLHHLSLSLSISFSRDFFRTMDSQRKQKF